MSRAIRLAGSHLEREEEKALQRQIWNKVAVQIRQADWVTFERGKKTIVESQVTWKKSGGEIPSYKWFYFVFLLVWKESYFLIVMAVPFFSKNGSVQYFCCSGKVYFSQTSPFHSSLISYVSSTLFLAKVDFCQQEMPSLSCYWKGQICFVIETNTYDNLHKYIWRFPQIDVICLINFIRGQGWLLSAGNAFIKLSLERSRQSVFSLLDQNNHRQSLGRIKWIFFRKYCSYLPFSKSPLIEVFAK